MDDYKIIVEQEHQTVMAHYDVPVKPDGAYQSEAKLENAFINQLMAQGYVYHIIHNEEGLLRNLREQLEVLNEIHLSDSEWARLLPMISNEQMTIQDKTEMLQGKGYILALKLLENLLVGYIRKYERTNVVQSLKFSEMMNNALSNYLKGLLTNEEVIAELLRIAEEIKRTEEEADNLGLSIEEKAFYDALSTPEGVREAFTNEQFVELTKELTEQLRRNRTIDWNHKESARAKMRVLVKRLLKKYHYPPEGLEKALETVMAQCNKWADDEGNFYEEENNDLIGLYPKEEPEYQMAAEE